MIADKSNEWVEEGSFLDADGKSVRAYDDVALTREIQVEGGVRTELARAPAGTVGTVLLFGPGPDGTAQLELRPTGGGFTFGIEETRRLRLHQTNEEKYPT